MTEKSNKPTVKEKKVPLVLQALSTDKAVETISKTFGGDVAKAKRFLSAGNTLVRTLEPKILNNCDPNSVFSSLRTIAELDLIPNKEANELALVGYWNSAKGKYDVKLTIQYQGFIKLGLRTPEVSGLYAELVHEKDEFRVERGTINTIIHRPNFFSDRGPVIGVYAVLNYKGDPISVILSKDDIEKFKALAKTKKFWDSKNDPMKWMWKKTAIKQVLKLLPKETQNTNSGYQLIKAIDIDNQDTEFYTEIDSSIVSEIFKANTREELKAVNEKYKGLGKSFSKLVKQRLKEIKENENNRDEKNT